MNLKSFPGPITITDSTFEANILAYQSCDVAASMASGTFSSTDKFVNLGTKNKL